MGIRIPQNPGIGGLDELTSAEEAFVQNIAGLSYAQGDILYHDGSDIARLAAGTSGQLLKTNGAGANPAWISASGTGDFLADGSVPMTGDFNLDGRNIDNGGVIFLKEQADADADVAGSGQLWVNTATPNELFFTDDAGTDFQIGTGLLNVVEDTTPQLGGALDGQGNDLNNMGVVFLTEQTEAEADVAGKGQLWVDTASPNVLKFTDDAGTDFLINNAAVANLSGSNTGDEVAADLTTAGVIEIATGAETNTGSDATRAVSPDGLDDWTGSAQVLTVGILDSGSITSGFGTIDNGASAITTSGVASLGSIVLGVDGTIAAITLSEKTSIALDPAGGADGDYTGITFTAVAGATVAFGDVVYLLAGDSEWYLVDADAVATSGIVAVAICVTAGTNGNAVTLMASGIIRADAGFPTLTIGAPVYISTTGTTTNTVTVTAPSGADDVVRVLGFALTANEMLFNPSPDHITVTG